jgi:hypothetical protein
MSQAVPIYHICMSKELRGMRDGGACTYHDYGDHQHDTKQDTEHEHHVAARFGVYLSFRLLRYGGLTGHAATCILGGLGREESLDEFLNLDHVFASVSQIPETGDLPRRHHLPFHMQY